MQIGQVSKVKYWIEEAEPEAWTGSATSSSENSQECV